MQGGNGSIRVSEAPRADPQCEALFKLFDGALGTVELGRLLKGSDAGRLVTLRKLSGAPSPDLCSATDLARSVAHPRLAKVLGSIVGKGAWYVASEYIPGVTLFELGEAVDKQGSLAPSVAVRIVLDTLTAASDAQELLGATANLHDVRCIFSESIWLAVYGEVFVAEVLIAPLLADVAGTSSSGQSWVLADLRSAGRELSRLLGDGPQLSPELIEIVRRMTGAPDAFQSLREAIDALRELDPELIASEPHVSEELQRVLGRVIEQRNQKIQLFERGATQAAEDDQTRYFRVAAPPERHDTTRPPEAARVSIYAAHSDNSKTGPPEAVRVSAHLYAANSDNSTTEPPGGELTAVGRVAEPEQEGEPTVTPGGSPIQEVEVEDVSNPISDVWRQARELLDTSAQRAKQHGRPVPEATRRRAPEPLARPRLRERAAELIRSSASDTERVITPKVALVIAGVLALALVIRALW